MGNGKPDLSELNLTAVLRIFSTLMILTSIAFSVLSLIPFPTASGYKSVGTHLWRIFRRHPSVERDLALLMLSGLSKTDIQRRDLPLHLSDLANALEDNSGDFATARLIKYAIMLDRQEILAAGVALNDATRCFAQVPEIQRSAFWFERAYFVARYRRQPEEAAQCLAEGLNTFVIRPMLQLRAEAAIAFSKENWQGAKDKAQSALENYKRWGEPIAARVEAEQMRDLLSRAAINLKI